MITWDNPADIYSGTALDATQLNAIAKDPDTAANVAGTFVYNPPTGTILNVGTHKLNVAFTPNDAANYTSASKEVTINISEKVKKTPVITWNNPADIYSGTALSTTQLNAVAKDPDTAATVAGTFVYTPAAETILSTGTHTLHVEFTPTDTANYTTASKDVSINVTWMRSRLLQLHGVILLT